MSIEVGQYWIHEGYYGPYDDTLCKITKVEKHEVWYMPHEDDPVEQRYGKESFIEGSKRITDEEAHDWIHGKEFVVINGKPARIISKHYVIGTNDGEQIMVSQDDCEIISKEQYDSLNDWVKSRRNNE